MKKSFLIIILISLVSTWIGCSDPDTTLVGDNLNLEINRPKQLEFRPRTKQNPTKPPRKPAACPISGYFSDNEIYLISTAEGEASIYVYSKSEDLIYYDNADLSLGYTFNLSDLTDAEYISVILNEIEYITEIEIDF